MEASNTNKRKKRKSRKCLDEIRKRSRRTGQILFKKDSGEVSGHFYNYNTVTNCLVTNNRLTLRMFPKAVRSETITRPALADLKEKPNLKMEELVMGTKVISSTSFNIKMPGLIHTLDNSVEHLKTESCEFSNECLLESDVKYKNCQEKLPSNVDLINSIDSAEMTDKSPDSTGAQSISSLTTSTNQSVRDDFGYSLYEEFMSGIPTYLKQNVKITEEDVMKKTKMFLQNLYIGSCFKDCDDNVLDREKGNSANKTDCTPSEKIVHNPMDYIKLGHVQQVNLFHRTSRLGGPIDDGCNIPHSPLLAPSLPATSPESRYSVIVNDTPDYTYYPHRLN